MAKNIEDLPELDFRREVIKFLEDKKAKSIAERINLEPSRLSVFTNQKGGIPWQTLLRLIIVMDYKIVDSNGKTVLGNRSRREQELSDNTSKAQEI